MKGQNRIIKSIIMLASFMLFTFISNFAFTAYGQATIRIEPHAIDPPNPVMLTSPANFVVNVTRGTAYNPQILLVMTQACRQGLSDDVEVTWTGGSISFSKSDFTGATNGFIPPSTPGADYQVSSLRSHLGVPESETIYYALGEFLSSPITTTPQSFEVTLPSTAPKMLVYAIGENSEGGGYNNRVPNSRPGFVVPELGTMLMAGASLIALVIYSAKTRSLITR